MKKNVMIFVSFLLVSLNTFSATEFNMSFSTVAPGGAYSPKNVVVAWVTQTNGTFIKTILRRAGTRANDLATWWSAAGSSGDADAVLGATRTSHTVPALVATWDLKNKAGTVVPDGTYLIKLECAEDNTASGRQSYTFNFVKDSNTGTRTNAGNTFFKNISIAYVPPNAAPVAQSQSVTTAEDTAKAITLVATDAETNAMTYAIVASPAHGTLSGTAPNVTYTPATNYYGADSFTFRANDATSTGNTATVSITVTPVNDAPVAQAQSVTTAEDTAKAITLLATDVETNALTYVVVTNPVHGVLSGVAPNLTYTPATNYFGADSFTFKANDGLTDSVPATISITVTAVNDAPVAQAQSISTAEDTAKAITLVATDAETNALTYAVVTSPAHGTLSIISSNSITYSPATNYFGSDSFTFKANDGLTDSVPATVSITVTPVNDPPVAQTQTVFAAQNKAKAITLVAIDVETNALTYAVVTGPAHGTLGVISSNVVTYTPATNYSGPDSFTFNAYDGTVTGNTATVTISVAPNTAPVAQSQSVTNAEDTAVVITLVATDFENDPLTYAMVVGPVHGTLSAISSNFVTYTPATNYYGTDSFTFKANDGATDSIPATVSITVTAVNDAPVAQAQSVSTPEDTALPITLVATDAETNALTYVVVTNPVHGVLSGVAPNLTYTPATNYYGTDSFIFKANDGTSDSALATISITVTPVNDPPVAQNQSVDVVMSMAKAITLVATDVETNALTYTIVISPSHGVLSGTAPNVIYTPTTDYSGSDSFTFKANDGIADSAVATISLNVTANFSPVSESQSVTTVQNTAKAITLVATDAETNAITYAVVADPAHGALSGTAPNVTYTPATNYIGSDSFTFNAYDGISTGNTVTVSITVTVMQYALTVNGGAGGGSYTNAAKVTITATPVAGKVFFKWLGATQYVAGITSSTAVVTMPASAVTLTASNVVDTTKPTVAITLPTAALRISNATYTVRGTAADNKVVTNVMVNLNNGAYVPAVTTNGWKNWSTEVQLAVGSNTVRAYSTDLAFNSSATATVACTYVVLGNLTIQTNGVGTVTRAPTGAPEVAKTYTLTAAAGIGSVFSNWTGDMITSTNKVLSFTMPSNRTIRANFTDIAKPTVAITAPTALQKVFGTNGDFVVRGTATDNSVLSNVMVSVNGALPVPASTTTNVWKSWSLPVTLSSSIAGVTNTITAYSRDLAGNTSATVTVKCVYTEIGTLNIITNGPGKVTVAPTGLLLLGKTYTLTAAANAGGIFSNWTGDVVIGNPTSKVVKITLDVSNKTKTVTANFTDLLKPTVAITYPANNSKVMTNGTVVIRGTAADNGALKEVKYQLRTGEWTNAATTNVWKNWTANYVPVAGLNTSKVYSVDVQGNVSITSTVVFTYLPGAMMTVQTNGQGTITPSLNGKVLQIGSTNTMTATAKAGYVFTNWTDGVGTVTNKSAVTFIMQSNLVLTANFRSLSPPLMSPLADIATVTTQKAAITVDGIVSDWIGVPGASFSYSFGGNRTVTQEVAVALDGTSVALLLAGCPFSTSDTVLVYFHLHLTHGATSTNSDHSVDLWTSGKVLYGMVDGVAIAGLERVLLTGVLEVKFPVPDGQPITQATIQDVGCGIDLGGGTLTELFGLTLPPVAIP